MSQQPFVDHYETLQLSPNADTEAVERVYRLLAKRYHPDNGQTGDIQKFQAVLEAYQVLSDAERRAAYDVRHDSERNLHLKLVRQASSNDAPTGDQELCHGILSLLYVARRRDPERGGLGSVHLERMMDHPQEHLAFPIWYLKQHGFIERLDNGVLAITVHGIDRLTGAPLRLPDDRLLPPSPVNAA